MALCTKCGMILHDEDAEKHICKAQDLPAKGSPKKPTTTIATVE